MGQLISWPSAIPGTRVGYIPSPEAPDGRAGRVRIEGVGTRNAIAMGDVVLGSNLDFAALRGRPGGVRCEVPVSDPAGRPRGGSSEHAAAETFRIGHPTHTHARTHTHTHIPRKAIVSAPYTRALPDPAIPNSAHTPDPEPQSWWCAGISGKPAQWHDRRMTAWRPPPRGSQPRNMPAHHGCPDTSQAFYF